MNAVSTLPEPSSAAASPLVVVCLCAAWCDTCRAFRAAFDRLAAQHDATFLWLDIEDDAELCGDVEVDSFPTIAVYRDATLLHFGVSLPLEGHVARLLDELSARDSPFDDAPDEVRALIAELGPRPVR